MSLFSPQNQPKPTQNCAHNVVNTSQLDETQQQQQQLQQMHKVQQEEQLRKHHQQQQQQQQQQQTQQQRTLAPQTAAGKSPKLSHRDTANTTKIEIKAT